MDIDRHKRSAQVTGSTQRASTSTRTAQRMAAKHEDHAFVEVSSSHYISSHAIDDVLEHRGMGIVSFCDLFIFASAFDYMLMVVGSAGAIACGIAPAWQAILLGEILRAVHPEADDPRDQVHERVAPLALKMAIVGGFAMVGGFLQVACWSMVATRQVRHLRREYAEQLWSHNVAWFERHDAHALGARIAHAAAKMQRGIGMDVGDTLRTLTMSASGLVVGFTFGWEMTLVILAFVPCIWCTSAIGMQSTEPADGRPHSIAYDALANVRTVQMLNRAQYFIDKYRSELARQSKCSREINARRGASSGLALFLWFCAIAAATYCGSIRVSQDQLNRHHCGDDCYDGGNVVTVLVAIVTAALALNSAFYAWIAVVSARVAAFDVFAVILFPTQVDPLRTLGNRPRAVDGAIELENVTLTSSDRNSDSHCCNYSLLIEPRETIALVGANGSGKSTIMALLERFHDPERGIVRLDGINVRELNLCWLREQIGIIGHETVLLATTIMENIRVSCPNATDDQVRDAARRANADAFITEYPREYDTHLGEHLSSLTEGEKQRIAIARVLLRNPAIVIIDEVVSKAHPEREQVVQELMETVLTRTKSTKIIIADGVASAQLAQTIAVHHDGNVVELGTHDELMEIPEGRYRQFVRSCAHTDVRRTKTIKTVGSKRSSCATSATDVASMDLHDRENCFNTMLSATPEDSNDSVATTRLFQTNAPEWQYIAVLALGSTLATAAYPLQGVLLAKITVLLFRFDDHPGDPVQLRTHACWWVLGLLLLGVLIGVGTLVLSYRYARASSGLTTRLRTTLFKSMLRQDVAWLTRSAHVPNVLASCLDVDVKQLESVVATRVHQIVLAVTMAVTAVSVALFYSWRMTLASLATLPPLIFALFVWHQHANDIVRSDNGADVVLVQALTAIQSVCSANLERGVLGSIMSIAFTYSQRALGDSLVHAFLFGMANAVSSMTAAFVFWIGARWISRGVVEFEALVVVQMVLITSLFALGNAMQVPANKQAQAASSRRVFGVIDRSPAINAMSAVGEVLTTVNGDIVFDHVAVFDADLPTQPILKDFALHIGRGKTVSLLERDKSCRQAVIDVLLRFRDPDAGAVLLDGRDLRSLDVPSLRTRIRVVDEEPMFFCGSIRMNIGLGDLEASNNEIEEAARLAGADTFIANLPDGYDTAIGDGGAILPMQQLQRIALARALVGQPDVLVVPSDCQPVQPEADRDLVTTIVMTDNVEIAGSANMIAVMKQGRVIELGSRCRLMALPDGEYFRRVEEYLELPSVCRTPPHEMTDSI